MTIGPRMVLGVCAAALAGATASLFVMRANMRNESINLMRDGMRTALMEAESVRESVSSLNQRQAFDRQKLLQEVGSGGDFRKTTIYDTVPIISALRAVDRFARQQGYEFRVPKHQPRNPANLPNAEEEVILKALEGGAAEWSEIHEGKNEIVFARPVRLTSDCMACHGDPATSPTHDGRDVFGFPMENWHAGEVHGALVLRAKLDKVDDSVRAGMGKTLLWMVPVLGLLAVGFGFLAHRHVLMPLREGRLQFERSRHQRG